MRLFLAGALLIATTATGASAQVTFSSSPANAGGDPGHPGELLVVDFEGPAAGVTLSGSYTIGTGLVPGFRAPPFGVMNNYFAVPNVDGPSNGMAVINFTGYLASRTVNSLSFYWGSIDTYNTLEVLGMGGSVLKTITGSQVINPADGNQFGASTNRRLFLNFDGNAALDFRALRLTSNGRAFEIDNIAGSFAQGATVVPEPSTWATLAFGLVVLGAAAARRNSLSSRMI